MWKKWWSDSYDLKRFTYVTTSRCKMLKWSVSYDVSSELIQSCIWFGLPWNISTEGRTVVSAIALQCSCMFCCEGRRGGGGGVGCRIILYQHWKLIFSVLQSSVLDSHRDQLALQAREESFLSITFKCRLKRFKLKQHDHWKFNILDLWFQDLVFRALRG